MVLYFGGDLLPGPHILGPPTASKHILWAAGYCNPHWPKALQLFGGRTGNDQEASKKARWHSGSERVKGNHAKSQIKK